MDALENMPSYVKFMKKILASKKKLEEYGTIALIEECSAIPFSIGNQVSGKALLTWEQAST